MMKFILPVLLCLLSNILWPSVIFCQSIEMKIDGIVSTVFSKDGPGVSVIAVKEGRVIYRKAFGKADLELAVGMNEKDVFRIGSITKQFTACAILKLAENGKLSIQDTITKYIPDFPMHGYAITIENLLTHTSGIKDYTGLSSFTTNFKRSDHTPKELINFFKNESLDFEPGTRMQYCNSGYILLGYIIELVSGKPYQEYIKENFFGPLGMTHSSYDNSSKIIPGRIPGYQKREADYENADFLSMTIPYAAGSLLSNIDDLCKWYNGLMNYKVVNKENLDKAFTSGKLKNGKLTGYGYGWWLGNIQESKAVKHVGKINGFLTSVLFLPEEKIFVAILSNCDCTGDIEIPASKIAALLLEKPYLFQPVILPEMELRSYQGIYSSEDNAKKIIRYEDGKLRYFSRGGLKTPIYPMGNGKFFDENSLTTLEFNRKTDGTIQSFQQKNTGLPEIWSCTEEKIVPVKEIHLDSAVLEKYAGHYEFPRGNVFKIVHENKKLYGEMGHDKKEIIAYQTNKFYGKEIDAYIIFNFDENGIVISLTKIQNSEMTARKIK